MLRSIRVAPNIEVAVAHIGVKSKDGFLLSSDGLWGEVGDPEIAEVLARESPSGAAGELADLANTRGGSDDLPVQIATLWGTEEESTSAMSTNETTEKPDPNGPDARPTPPDSGTRALPRGEKSRWARPGVIAASLLVAIALFWRICA